MKKNIQNSGRKSKPIQGYLGKVERTQLINRLSNHKIRVEQRIDGVAAYGPNRLPSVTRKSIINKNARLVKALEIILTDLRESEVQELVISSYKTLKK